MTTAAVTIRLRVYDRREEISLLAGGGVEGGQMIGATDDVGYVPVERPLTPADMHATLLHALGIDQHRLTYEHNNRDEIPTVFGGNVIKEVFL